MAGFRPARMAGIIHQEVASLLAREAKDPRLEPISITRVVVTPDLRRATIEYLPLGGGSASNDLRDGLVATARHLRGPVGRALGIRHAPELVFEEDRHTESAIRVTHLIEEIHRQAAPPVAPDADLDIAEEE